MPYFDEKLFIPVLANQTYKNSFILETVQPTWLNFEATTWRMPSQHLWRTLWTSTYFTKPRAHLSHFQVYFSTFITILSYLEGKLFYPAFTHYAYYNSLILKVFFSCDSVFGQPMGGCHISRLLEHLPPLFSYKYSFIPSLSLPLPLYLSPSLVISLLFVKAERLWYSKLLFLWLSPLFWRVFHVKLDIDFLLWLLLEIITNYTSMKT